MFSFVRFFHLKAVSGWDLLQISRVGFDPPCNFFAPAFCLQNTSLLFPYASRWEAQPKYQHEMKLVRFRDISWVRQILPLVPAAKFWIKWKYSKIDSGIFKPVVYSIYLFGRKKRCYRLIKLASLYAFFGGSFFCGFCLGRKTVLSCYSFSQWPFKN